VAYTFASRQEDSFDINQNVKGRKLKVSIDFKEEYNVDAERTYRIKEVIHIAENDEPDIALMRVYHTSYDGHQLPEGLEISIHESEPGDDVCTIGYPGVDSLAKQTQEMKEVFMDIYDVKRLSPGQIFPSAAAEFIYHHDCSTWYGNSGSPILELSSGKVVGVHYGGDKVEYGGIYTNWAVRSVYLIELLEELDIEIPS
jgi:endonuclease G